MWRRSGTVAAIPATIGAGYFVISVSVATWPTAIATADIQSGIMAGKLKGVIPAATPNGSRIE